MEMMEDEFGERCIIFEDPETGEDTLHKVSDEEISESEFHALRFFEMGWNKALKSFERMGATYLENAIEEAYGREDEQDAGRNTGGAD